MVHAQAGAGFDSTGLLSNGLAIHQTLLLKDERLRRAFSIQPLLVGGNPFSTTSIYSLIHYLERRWGVHFPRGGTGAPQALGKLMVEQGINIRLGETVAQIQIEDGRATGVTLETAHRSPRNGLSAMATRIHLQT